MKDRSATIAAKYSDALSLEQMERITRNAREAAEQRGELDKWLDEFWHGFALVVCGVLK